MYMGEIASERPRACVHKKIDFFKKQIKLIELCSEKKNKKNVTFVFLTMSIRFSVIIIKD